MDQETRLTKRQAMIDVSVVGGCSIAYVFASFFPIPIGVMIASIVLVLFVYGYFLSHRSQPWRNYGLRTDNLWVAGWRVGIWTVLATLGIVVFALAHGYSLARPELLIMIPLYPLWGVVQQFIFQGILHRALLQLIANPWLALAVNSVAFAAVHVADVRVTGLTFLAGLCWSWFYQRWPNIWVLGISHGIIAALTYPLLLNENPLERFF